MSTTVDGGSGSSDCSLPLSLLDDYNDGTALIRYRDGSGKVKDWLVGCLSVDNESTLRDHLRRHLPAAEFVGFVLK